MRPSSLTGKVGGARRDRTDDILLAKQALSQLSYGPITETCQQELVGPGRLELPTSRLSGVRSNHLSYGPHWHTPVDPSARSGERTLTRELTSLVKKEKRRRRVFRSSLATGLTNRSCSIERAINPKV